MSAPIPDSPAPRPDSRWPSFVAWVVAVLALLAVFALYTDPHFMVLLANQVWSCF